MDHAAEPTIRVSRLKWIAFALVAAVASMCLWADSTGLAASGVDSLLQQAEEREYYWGMDTSSASQYLGEVDDAYSPAEMYIGKIGCGECTSLSPDIYTSTNPATFGVWCPGTVSCNYVSPSTVPTSEKTILQPSNRWYVYWYLVGPGLPTSDLSTRNGYIDEAGLADCEARASTFVGPYPESDAQKEGEWKAHVYGCVQAWAFLEVYVQHYRLDYDGNTLFVDIENPLCTPRCTEEQEEEGDTEECCTEDEWRDSDNSVWGHIPDGIEPGQQARNRLVLQGFLEGMRAGLDERDMADKQIGVYSTVDAFTAIMGEGYRFAEPVVLWLARYPDLGPRYPSKATVLGWGAEPFFAGEQEIGNYYSTIGGYNPVIWQFSENPVDLDVAIQDPLQGFHPRPAETTVETAIFQSSDDAGIQPDDCIYSTSWNEIYFGECGTGEDITSGFRFPVVAVPQGAEVISAHIQFTVDGPYDDVLTVAFYGEAADDAETFSLESRPDDRPLTQASAIWHIDDHWELGQTRDSPDLSAVVQEIVSRPNWSPHNALAIIVKNAGPASGTLRHRRVIGYDRPSWYPGDEYGARLIVTFKGDPPPPPPPPPPPALSLGDLCRSTTLRTVSWDVQPLEEYMVQVARDDAFTVDVQTSQWLSGGAFVARDLTHGTWYYRIRARNAGGEGPWSAPVPAYQDHVGPTTTATLSGDYDSAARVYTSPVQVTLSAADDGCAGLYGSWYRVDNSTASVYRGPFTVSEDGAHTVTFRSCDNLSNCEGWKDVPFRIDTAPPPSCSCIFGCDQAGSVARPQGRALLALSRIQQAADVADLLYRVRDEVLSQTDEGQHFNDVYYAHSPEIAYLMLSDPALYDQGFAVLDLFVPGLQALVDGQGDVQTITAEQVQEAQAFLDALAAAGSPELQQAIADESARHPLDQLVGMTFAEAWTYLSGDTLMWFPPTQTVTDTLEATFVVRIANMGDVDDVYVLEGDASPALEMIFEPTSVSVSHHSVANVAVTATAPTVGDYTLTAQATSAGSAAVYSGTASLAVVTSNVPPVAGDDEATTDEDLAVTIAALGNDVDADGDGLNIASVTQPAHGSVVNSGVDVVYTPDENYCGHDSFSYVVSDGVLTDTATVDVTVVCVNDPPQVEAGAARTVSESDLVSLDPATFVDPDVGDTHTATIDWGDGAVEEGVVEGNTIQGSHAYSDDGDFAVEICVTDAAGETGCDSLIVTVNNVAPVVDAGVDVAIDEGGTLSVSGTFADPGADTWTATVDYGDGSGVQPLSLVGNGFDLSHTYADDGTYDVAVCVMDDDEGLGCDTLVVTVHNVAPAVDAGVDQSVNPGQPVQFDGSFTDPGLEDEHAITWDFGDGGTAEGTLSLVYSFAQEGVYTVTLTVADDDGGVGVDTVSIVVRPKAEFESFQIEHATIHWLGRYGDTAWFRMEGRLTLPEGYAIEDLNRELRLELSFGGKSLSDGVSMERHGQLWYFREWTCVYCLEDDMQITNAIVWYRPESEEFRFVLYGAFSMAGVDHDTQPAEVTVQLSLGLTEGHSLDEISGEQTISFESHRRVWLYRERQ